MEEVKRRKKRAKCSPLIVSARPMTKRRRDLASTCWFFSQRSLSLGRSVPSYQANLISWKRRSAIEAGSSGRRWGMPRSTRQRKLGGRAIVVKNLWAPDPIPSHPSAKTHCQMRSPSSEGHALQVALRESKSLGARYLTIHVNSSLRVLQSGSGLDRAAFGSRSRTACPSWRTCLARRSCDSCSVGNSG